MSILSDGEIHRRVFAKSIVINPFNERQVQPASYDVLLSPHFIRLILPVGKVSVDPRKKDQVYPEQVMLSDGQAFILAPGQFALGSTEEYVAVPNDLVARLEGKSSLARLGLVIHSTAGYIDPGFKGQVTLELSNVSDFPIELYSYMPIGQLSFSTIEGTVRNPYGSARLNSKYQEQRGATESKYSKNFTDG